MELLTWTIVAGMATAFSTEFIIRLVDNWIHPRIVRVVLTIPIAYGASWCLGVSFPSIVTATLAAGFFSTTLLLIVDRASIVNIRR
jgi:hypothetical protein